MKKILAMLLAVAMVFAIGAIPAFADEAPAEKTWRDYDLSGEITIYTTQTEVMISLIEDAFAEAYPDVTLNFVVDNTGTLITRLDVEKENPVADAFFGALGQMDGTAYHEYFEPYDNCYLDESLMVDPYGIYNYFMVAVNCIMLNPDLIKEAGVDVKALSDLFHPELQGMVGFGNINTSSSAFRNLVAMLYGAGNGDPMSDEAWAFAGKIMEAMGGHYGHSFPTGTANGEYAASIFYEDSALANQHDGMNIVTIFPEDYNLACFIGSAVVKNAPNLDGAHAVVDYICSAEYQQQLVDVTQAFRPANKNVELTVEEMPAYEELPLVDWDPAYVIEHTQEIYDRWNTMWQEKGYEA